MLFLSFFLSTFPALLVIYILLLWIVCSCFFDNYNLSRFLQNFYLPSFLGMGGEAWLSFDSYPWLWTLAQRFLPMTEDWSRSLGNRAECVAAQLPPLDIDLVGMRRATALAHTLAPTDASIFPFYIFSWVYSVSIHFLFCLSKDFILYHKPFSKPLLCLLAIILGLHDTILSLLTVTYLKFI